jgi:RNA recognition motif-containing protein
MTNTRLYVGNLEWSVDEVILQSIFGKIGNIKTSTVIRDRDTGRSKGFGFVEMTTSEEAEKAIQDLNGEFINGRQIMVREAKPEGATVSQGFEKTINEFLTHAEPDNETDFSIGKKHFVIVRDR